jgi:hypothetical protein
MTNDEILRTVLSEGCQWVQMDDGNWVQMTSIEAENYLAEQLKLTEFDRRMREFDVYCKEEEDHMNWLAKQK